MLSGGCAIAAMAPEWYSLTRHRLAVLISGRGTNLQAIVEACRNGKIPDCGVSGVISSRPDAPGLDWSRKQEIPSQTLSHRDFPGREPFDSALAQAIDRLEPDWVVLAGFMRQLTPAFVERYLGRLVNIHPSLLPAFPGLHTHRSAIDAGVCWHGATVHFVTQELDAGPIIAQGIIPVASEDSADSLARKVLSLEHRLYPQALSWLVAGQVALRENRSHWTSPPPASRSGAMINPEAGIL